MPRHHFFMDNQIKYLRLKKQLLSPIPLQNTQRHQFRRHHLRTENSGEPLQCFTLNNIKGGLKENSKSKNCPVWTTPLKMQSEEQQLLNHIREIGISRKVLRPKNEYSSVQRKTRHTVANELGLLPVNNKSTDKEGSNLITEAQLESLHNCGSIKVNTLLSILRELEQLGYRKKINFWVTTYCQRKQKWLRQVFLTASRQQSFSDVVKKWFNPSSSEIQLRLRNLLAEGNFTEGRIINEELEEFVGFVEAILIQKKNFELTKISEGIQAKLKINAALRPVAHPEKLQHVPLKLELTKEDKDTFMGELISLQEKYGTISCVSKDTRQRHYGLNATYAHLQSLLQ